MDNKGLRIPIMTIKDGLTLGSDGKHRCSWSGATEEYAAYHDHEWGRPVTDDTRLFEKICLEGFQAGLSWLTILRKRENFRHAFAGFDIAKVARFDARDLNRLLKDAGIVRHRGKIESTINNAKRAKELIDEHGSLAAYFWSHEPAAKSRPENLDLAVTQPRHPCTTPGARTMACSQEDSTNGFVIKESYPDLAT